MEFLRSLFGVNVDRPQPAKSQKTLSSTKKSSLKAPKPIPVERCFAPKCYRDTSGKCVLPNPWNVFQKTGEAQELTVEDRQKAYPAWKAKYMAQAGNDPVAFNAALCMGRPLKTVDRNSPATLVKRHLVGLRKRLEENRVHYVRDCDIGEETLAFFNTLIPTTIQGTTLNHCQVAGLMLLRKCVPPGEVKFYTFEKVLGVGLHGFVFLCRYKRTEQRAVKFMVIHEGGDQNEYEVPVDSSRAIVSVSKKTLMREFDMHQHFSHIADKRNSHFRVLKILSDMAVFKPPKFKKCVGVYVMEMLPFTPFDNEIEAHLTKFPNSPLPRLMLDKAAEVARLMGVLHENGVAHSDLHSGNIAFDPKSPRDPYILDFGRAQILEKLGTQATLYRMIEYAVPLESYLRSFKESPKAAVQLCNAHLTGIQLSPADRQFVAARDLDLIFQPFPVDDAKSKYDELGEFLLEQKLFVHQKRKYNYFTVTEKIF